jgi:tRNA threonylcarbamoyladenosine biosynthesis protein TsaE
MQKDFVTTNAKQTQKLGEILAREIKGGEIICLSGELGAGKTTFTQGFLKGLGIKGPHTSPTFLIMKHYKKEIPKSKLQISNKSQKPNDQIQNIFHFDSYRVGTNDILALGWEEIIADKKNVVIIEWAERVREIVPTDAVWVRFEWVDEEKRKLKFT